MQQQVGAEGVVEEADRGHHGARLQPAEDHRGRHRQCGGRGPGEHPRAVLTGEGGAGELDGGRQSLRGDTLIVTRERWDDIAAGYELPAARVSAHPANALATTVKQWLLEAVPAQNQVVLKTPPAAVLIMKALKIEKGSARPNKEKVGKLTRAQAEEIAKTKTPDLTAADLDAAVRTVAGSARSMGVEVEGV